MVGMPIETVLTPIPPIDVSAFIPVGTTTIVFDLRDFGGIAGNTDLFLAVTPAPTGPPTPPPNVPPNAAAGPDQNAVVLTLVTLNGSGSDPDNGPNPLIFQWTFVSTPAGSTLTNSGVADATTATASFIPDVPGDYELRLDVSDGVDTAFDQVAVTVQTAPPPPPPTTPPPPPPAPPPSADIELSQTDIPDPLTVNGQLTYTITVTNNGPGIATGVQVVDSLPPGAVLPLPASSSHGRCGVRPGWTATSSRLPPVIEPP